MNPDLLNQVKIKAQSWLEANYDEATKNEVKRMLDHDENELLESFYKNLEFGTGGLRGIMGVGTNRINNYTIGMATQGLCNYILKCFPNEKEPKAVIAHDCRNNGQEFAKTTANIFAANGFKVYLFESLRPTPELSFALRHFNCKTGVVITASHNPKEYNGYKAYWEDGGQVIAPHDNNIIEEVQKIINIDQVKWKGNSENILTIGEDIDKLYIEKLKELSLSRKEIGEYKEMKIVYTPIHGTGVKLVPRILKEIGFENIINVPEQDEVNGNFPTVKSPNPEEAAALNMAIEKAKQTDAEMIMATDPDADRVGIAVKNEKGEYELLNGNQTGAFLIYYLIKKWKEKGLLKGKEYIVKTIVTTELIADMAKDYNIEYYDVLTGFKYIADLIKKNYGKKLFIGGGEESYGYLAGEFVRDKDAVMSCMLIAEATAWAKSQNKSLFDILIEMYKQYGFYKESLVNLVKKGKSGAEEIEQIMTNFRENPPKTLAGSKIVKIKDYSTQITQNLTNGEKTPIDLPKSNVLQFFTQEGAKISVRPSGTEPKIKFYIGVKGLLSYAEDYRKVEKDLTKKIQTICKDLGI